MNDMTQPDHEGAKAQRLHLRVTGMSCGACAARVEKELNQTDGVTASVNFATRVAAVDADSGINVADLCNVVRGAGYDAEECSDSFLESVALDERHAPGRLRRIIDAAVSPIDRKSVV